MLLYRSNDLDELASRLAEVIAEPGPGLLDDEVILIQSAGMERWLSRELSRRHGVLAGAEFPFPRAFLRRSIDAVLGEDTGSEAFERESLTWEVFRLLKSPPEGPVFDAVRSNLEGDVDGSARLLLAEKLANFFDQYVTFRPQMIGFWERGGDPDDFQAVLWRMLVERLGQHHFAERCRRFLEVATDEELRRELPCRVCLVGGPGLPPLFLQLLARIGRAIPVHVFSFSVSQEYFADLHPLDEPVPEIGQGVHPLLVSLGKVGGDFQHLAEQVEYSEGTAEYRLPEAETLLGALQRDIAEGAARSGEGLLARSALLDASLTLDACHSRLREVEILHDRLLGWFDEDPTLKAEDIVVLAPNIETYSPLVSAVFGARGGGAIPHRVADRVESATNAAARSLLLGLRLLPGRLKVGEVLDFLQCEPVLARFKIDPTGLERIGQWAESAGIRWGADAQHREMSGLPADETNTWRRGLSRLLLGYAHADDGDAWLRGVVPVDDVPARDAELLGSFASFVETLLALQRRLRREGLSPPEWRSFLQDFSEGLLGESPDAEWDVGVVRQQIGALMDRAETALSAELEQGVSEDQEVVATHEPSRLGLSGILHLLGAALESSRPSTDFLAGGVTFCELLPLRTIPFRRVCVLGLEQGVFPRTDVPHELDRIASHPKRGDRSLRGDDRYLFLEVLLAARDRLAFSYVGRSVQDNTEKPPSAVLEDLRRVLETMVEPAVAGDDSRALPALEHPLHPFNAAYFLEARAELRSYDPSAYRAAAALVEARAQLSEGAGRARGPS